MDNAKIEELYNLLYCLDEFAGIFEVYEDTVTGYCRTIGSLSSLYQAAFYYSDGKIAWQMAFADRKGHLLKGTEYVEAFDRAAGNEESARMHLSWYFQLYEACRSGEDLEQLKYATKAYSLAKKYALKYKTDGIMEDFNLAKMGMTAYYCMHGQELEAQKIEKDYEETRKQMTEKIAY